MRGPNRKKRFDLFETKLVFKISRVFFWILVSLVGIGFICSFLVFLYSIFPPIKERVEEPNLPFETTLTIAEIESSIAPQPKIEKKQPEVKVKITYEKAKAEKKPKAIAPPDPFLAELNKKIDTLKFHFPTDKFNWEDVSQRVVVAKDAWGNPTKWATRIKIYGLKRHLNKVLRTYDKTKKKVDVVKELISIIPQINEDDRGKALEAYANIRIKKERARQNEINRIISGVKSKKYSANAKYLRAKGIKAQLRTKSLISFGGSIVSVAILGLFLVFLAIERNTRAIKAMYDKEK